MRLIPIEGTKSPMRLIRKNTVNVLPQETAVHVGPNFESDGSGGTDAPYDVNVSSQPTFKENVVHDINNTTESNFGSVGFDGTDGPYGANVSSQPRFKEDVVRVITKPAESGFESVGFGGIGGMIFMLMIAFLYGCCRRYRRRNRRYYDIKRMRDIVPENELVDFGNELPSPPPPLPPPIPRITYSTLPQPISPENNKSVVVDRTKVIPNKLTPEQQRVQKLLGDQLAAIYEARKG